MKTSYIAGYKGSTLILEESRNKQAHDWVEPTTKQDGTRYPTIQSAFEAFQRAGAGAKQHFTPKPVIT